MSNYKVIDLEHGRPILADTLKVLEQELRNGKNNRYAAIKLIHGYGSTGRGGKLRIGVRKALQKAKREGRIRDFVCGEEFSIFTPAILHTLPRCAPLSKDADLERRNQGITIVIF